MQLKAHTTSPARLTSLVPYLPLSQITLQLYHRARQLLSEAFDLKSLSPPMTANRTLELFLYALIISSRLDTPEMHPSQAQYRLLTTTEPSLSTVARLFWYQRVHYSPLVVTNFTKGH